MPYAWFALSLKCWGPVSQVHLLYTIIWVKKYKKTLNLALILDIINALIGTFIGSSIIFLYFTFCREGLPKWRIMSWKQNRKNYKMVEQNWKLRLYIEVTVDTKQQKRGGNGGEQDISVNSVYLKEGSAPPPLGC